MGQAFALLYMIMLHNFNSKIGHCVPPFFSPALAWLPALPYPTISLVSVSTLKIAKVDIKTEKRSVCKYQTVNRKIDDNKERLIGK